MSQKTQALLEAIEGFLNEPEPGTPPPVLAGLQNLSKGLRSRPTAPPSPGQQAVRDITGNDSIYEPEEEDLTPGQRAAVESTQ